MNIKFYAFALLILSLCFDSLAQNDKDVMMTIGESNVTVSEFRYIYEKNNNTKADYSAQSINEYIDLFTKFKLKVEKAKQMKLDTLSEIKTELAGYRKQLANTYLVDKEVTETLLKELYERKQKDVSFAHIFVAIDAKATEMQKAKAKAQIYDIKSKIVGGMSFDEVAKTYSEDKFTAPNGGYMGFYTAPLPDGFYDLESAIYNIAEGNVSDVVESKMGFHIVKVIEKRPAYGQISISQILLSPEDKKLADSLYNELQNGANFKDFVNRFSKDKNTVRGGGRLSPFGINTYDPDFESAAFALDKINKYSKPVKTKGGWHIIMFNERVNPDAYDLFVRRSKAQINKDQRFDVAKTKLVEDIKESANFKDNKIELTRLASQLDDEFFTYKWAPGSAISSNTLMSLDGKSYSVKDFASFCRKNTKTRLQYDNSKPIIDVLNELYDEFVHEKAIEYEEGQLENKYDDFKNLMREYEEGILLFEATKINVWDKANQDTTGLAKFYSQNSEKYMRNEMATLREIKLSNVNQKTASKIYKAAPKTDIIKLMSKYNKKSTVITFSEREVDTNDQMFKEADLKPGFMTALESVDESNWRFNKVQRITPPRPKTIGEARGFIVADYQEYLENQWMKELAREFPVKINETVLNQLIKR